MNKYFCLINNKTDKLWVGYRNVKVLMGKFWRADFDKYAENLLTYHWYGGIGWRGGYKVG